MKEGARDPGDNSTPTQFKVVISEAVVDLAVEARTGRVDCTPIGISKAAVRGTRLTNIIGKHGSCSATHNDNGTFSAHVPSTLEEKEVGFSVSL